MVGYRDPTFTDKAWLILKLLSPFKSANSGYDASVVTTGTGYSLDHDLHLGIAVTL